MTNFQRVLALSMALSLFSGCSRQSYGPPKENTFRMALVAKIPLLDPHQSNDVYQHAVVSNIVETLYGYHYLKRPLEVIPVLAEALPVWSADKKTMTVKLKKGIKFHDDPCFADAKGREVNADDVLYMFHRISGKNIRSTAYNSLEGVVVGIDEFHKGTTPTITGVKKIDNYTFEIKLTKKMPRFIFNFLDFRTGIIPKECVDKLGENFSSHPVGTGPYKIQEANLGHKIVLVKNPNYTTLTYPTDGNPGDKEKGLLENAGAKLPLIDKVVFEIIPESQPRWLKFMAGQLEALTIPKENIPQAVPGGKLSPELEAKGVILLREIKSDVTGDVFNMQDPVWGKHKELRQAFALARNMPKWIDIQYGGQAIQAHSFLDPTSYGYDPNFKSRWATRDVAKAKELLAKAGFPEGKGLPPIVFPTGGESIYRQMSEQISKELGEVGIKLQPEPMTWPEMMQRLQKGNFTMLGMGWASSVPDIDDSTGLFHSKYIASAQNGSKYSNPKVDKLIDEIEVLENGPERLRKAKELREILDDELPIVFAVHRVSNQLVQPWLKNHIFTDDGFWGEFIKYKRIETAQK